MEENKIHEVAFCLTSCGRMDELEKTVDSFIKYGNAFGYKSMIFQQQDLLSRSSL